MKLSEINWTKVLEIYDERESILDDALEMVEDFLRYHTNIEDMGELGVMSGFSVYDDDVEEFIRSAESWVSEGFLFECDLETEDDQTYYFEVVLPVSVFEAVGRVWSPITITDIDDLDAGYFEISLVENTCPLIP